MTATGPISPDRFEALADAYGGDVSRWPEVEREAAAAFMLADPARAAAVLGEAARLDSAMAAFSPPRAAAGAMARILASAPQPRVRRAWWSAWAAPAGMGVGLAAACAAGVILGGRLSAAAPATETDPVVTAVSDDDAALTFDEEA